MRRMGWECGAGNAKNAGNQGDDAGNQSGNLGIAIDMRQNGHGNNKFKKQREVKIIKNEHICKNLVLRI